MTRRWLALSARLLTAALISMPAMVSLASDYPTRSVRIVVPYAPGGPADTFARIVGEQLAIRWKQPVVVDNRAGATGIIGTQAVVGAKPDGYTLLVASGSTAIAVSLDDKLPYDTLRDLVPVSGLVSTPYFLLANPSLPADSVQALIELAKAKPGEIAFGSAGPGGTPHLSGEMFNLLAGTRMLHVPYKGTGPATVALLSGEVQLMFGSLTSTAQYVESKRLKVLGAADPKRSPFLPDVPTIAEAGLPGYAAENWFGLFAPAGIPDEIAKAIHEATAASLESPAVKAKLWELGAVPMPLSPQDFQAYFRQQVDVWGRVIDARNLKKQ